MPRKTFQSKSGDQKNFIKFQVTNYKLQMSRETFELRPGEHKTFMESTKSMVLLGTSKWFAKIIVKGRQNAVV